jgi:hypothetical protein
MEEQENQTAAQDSAREPLVITIEGAQKYIPETEQEAIGWQWDVYDDQELVLPAAVTQRDPVLKTQNRLYEVGGDLSQAYALESQDAISDQPFNEYENNLLNADKLLSKSLLQFTLDNLVIEDRMTAAQKGLIANSMVKIAESLTSVEAGQLDIKGKEAFLELMQDQQLLQKVLEAGDWSVLMNIEEREEGQPDVDASYNWSYVYKGLTAQANAVELTEKISKGIALNGDYLKGLKDFGQVILPFVETTVYTKIANEVFGSEVVPTLGASFAVDDIARKIVDADPVKRLQYIQNLENYIENNKDSFGSSNTFILAGIMDSVKSGLEGDPSGSTLQKVFFDLQNGLDLLLLWSAVKAVYGAGYRTVKNKLFSSPQADNTVTHAITDPETARALGIEPEVVLTNTAIPHPSGKGLLQLSEDQLAVLDYVQRMKGAGMTKAQLTDVINTAREHLANRSQVLEAKGIAYDHGRLKVVETDRGLEVSEVFVTNEKQYIKAQGIANNVFPDKNFRLVKNEETGMFDVIRDSTYTLGSEIASLSKVGFDAPMITHLFVNPYIVLPEARFNKEIVQLAGMMERASPALVGRIVEPMADAIKNLGDTQQRVLNDIMNKYEGQDIPKKAWETVPQATKDVYDYHIRPTMDLMWAIDNQTRRQSAIVDGKLGIHVKVGDEELDLIGKAYPDVSQVSSFFGKSNRLDVYDAAQGTVVSMTKEEVYDAGHMIARVDEAAESGLNVPFVLVRRDGAPEARMTDLPLNMVPYIPNYIPRVYDKLYMVGRTNSEGRDVIVHATNSRSEAIALAEKEGGFWRFSRETGMMEVDQNRVWKNRVESRNGLGVGSRATIEGLTDAAGNSAKIENALEAIQRGAAAFGNRHMFKDHLNNMKTQWLQSYGHLLKDNQGFPIGRLELKGTGDPKVLTEAESLHQYIIHLEGVNDGIMIESYRKMMIGLGAKADAIGLTTLGDAVSRLGMKDPTRSARAFSFHTLLSMNPSRQILMQGQHSLMSYAMVPNQNFAANMSNGLNVALAAVSNSKDMKAFYKTTAGQMTGISPDRFETLVNLYRQIGLDKHISVHNFFDQTLDHGVKKTLMTGTEKVAHTVGQVIMFVPELGKKIGFNTGETINVVGAYMSAVTKYENQVIQAAKAAGKTMTKDEVVITSREAMQQIAGDTANFLWHMSAKSGSAPYNSGLLGVLLQFFSIQHKGLSTMLPVGLGGRGDLTVAEKARAAGFVLANYGLDGLGITKFVDRLATAFTNEEDLETYFDSELRGYLKYGLMGTLINGVSGEKTSFSSTFSPMNTFASQVLLDADLGKAWDDVLNLNPTGLLQLTPFSSAATKYATAANSIRKSVGYEALDTNEKIQGAIKDIASVSGMMNNIEKWHLLNEFNTVFTKYGNTTINDMQQRNLVAALLGVRSTREEDLTDAIRKFYDNVPDISKSKTEETASEAAKAWLNDFQRSLLRYKGVVKSSEDFDRIVMQEARSHMRYLPDDNIYMMTWLNAVAKEISKPDNSLFRRAVEGAIAAADQKKVESFKKKFEAAKEYVLRSGSEEDKALLKDMENYLFIRGFSDESIERSIKRGGVE